MDITECVCCEHYFVCACVRVRVFACVDITDAERRVKAGNERRKWRGILGKRERTGPLLAPRPRDGWRSTNKFAAGKRKRVGKEMGSSDEGEDLCSAIQISGTL